MVFEINLLPEKYRKKRFAIQIDARFLGGAGGVVLIGLLAMMTINQGKTLSELEERHTDLGNRKIIVEQTANRVRNQKDEVRNINSRIATLQGLGGRNTIQLRILEIVSDKLPDEVYLLDFNQGASRQAQGGALSFRPDQILNFRGIALRKEGVTEWITRLQEEDLIQQVQTNYLRSTRVEGVDIYEFSLTTVMNIGG